MFDNVMPPWTDEQVVALERYQCLGYVHELTCPNDHSDAVNGHAVLKVTNNYLYCPICDYRQGWVPWVCISSGINSYKPRAMDWGEWMEYISTHTVFEAAALEGERDGWMDMMEDASMHALDEDDDD